MALQESLQTQRLTISFQNAELFPTDPPARLYFFAAEVQQADGAPLSEGLQTGCTLAARTALYRSPAAADGTTTPTQAAVLTLSGALVEHVQRADAAFDPSDASSEPSFVLLLKACWIADLGKKAQGSGAGKPALQAKASSLLKMPLVTVLATNMIEPLRVDFVVEQTKGLLRKHKVNVPVASANVLLATTFVTPPPSPAPPAAAMELPVEPSAGELGGDSTIVPPPAATAPPSLLPPLEPPEVPLSVRNLNAASLPTRSLATVAERPDVTASKGSLLGRQGETGATPMDVVVLVHDVWFDSGQPPVGVAEVKVCASAEGQSAQTSALPVDTALSFEERLVLPLVALAQPLIDSPPENAPQLCLALNELGTAGDGKRLATFLWPLDARLTPPYRPMLVTLHSATGASLRVTLALFPGGTADSAAPAAALAPAPLYPPGTVLLEVMLERIAGAVAERAAPMPLSARFVAAAVLVPRLEDWRRRLAPALECRRAGINARLPSTLSLLHAVFDSSGRWTRSFVNEADEVRAGPGDTAASAANPTLSGLSAGTDLPPHWQLLAAAGVRVAQRTLATLVSATPAWNHRVWVPLHVRQGLTEDTSLVIQILRDPPHLVQSLDRVPGLPFVDRPFADLVAYAYVPLAKVMASRLAAATAAPGAQQGGDRDVRVSMTLRLQFVEPYASMQATAPGSSGDVGLAVRLRLPTVADVRRALAACGSASLFATADAPAAATGTALPLATQQLFSKLLLELDTRFDAVKRLGAEVVTLRGENARLLDERNSLAEQLAALDARGRHAANVAELGLLSKDELERRYAILVERLDSETRRNQQLVRDVATLQNVGIERNELEKQLLRIQQAHVAQQSLVLHLQAENQRLAAARAVVAPAAEPPLAVSSAAPTSKPRLSPESVSVAESEFDAPDQVQLDQLARRLALAEARMLRLQNDATLDDGSSEYL